MEIPDHIDALRTEGPRMAAAAAVGDPEDAVPTCPEWVVHDLIRHTGAVHRWATGFVAGGRTEPSRLEEAAGTWPADGDLAGWLGQGCHDLVATLAVAPDDLQCWTFLAAPSPAAPCGRATGPRDGRAPGACAARNRNHPDPLRSGVRRRRHRRALDAVRPPRRSKLHADPPATLAVRCTDVDASWQLRMDADGVTTSVNTGSDAAACTVSGTAHDLYLALWNRTGADDLALEGDRAGVPGPVLRGGADPVVHWRTDRAGRRSRRGLPRRPKTQ